MNRSQSEYSAVNNSKAKARYSFSKSPRFKSPLNTSDVFYNLPTMKDRRNTTLGYGKKIDWDHDKDKTHIVPPPTTYQTQDFVKMNKSASKGFSTKVGREVFFDRVSQNIKNLSFVKRDEGMPGPGAYSPLKADVDNPKYSMRPQTVIQTFVAKSSLAIPGPGFYNQVDGINTKGKYFTSRHCSSRSKVFNPNRSARFPKTRSEAPGPGEYDPVNSIWENVEVRDSKCTSYGNRRFSTGKRSSVFEENPKNLKHIPGPGTYRPPSDFGYCDVDMSGLHQSDVQSARNGRMAMSHSQKMNY